MQRIVLRSGARLIAALVVIGACVVFGAGPWGRDGKFASEWRHYVHGRARDRADPVARRREPDFAYVIDVNRSGGVDGFLAELSARADRLDEFAQGDALLIEGRLRHDVTKVCASVPHFERSLDDAPDDFARAIIHETLFAVGRECGAARPQDLATAVSLWRRMDVPWRAAVEEQILHGDTVEIAAVPDSPSTLPVHTRHADRVTFGTDAIRLAPTMRVAGQAERVSRDWLALRLAAPWRIDPAIDYFEGAVVNAVARRQAAQTLALYGALVRRIGANWYAPDAAGHFTFLVLRDKVDEYPTTRFLADDVAMLVDAHGVSAVAALAVERRADVVVGCCDYFDKVRAATYLAERGIDVVCATDRFLGYAFGYDGPGTIIAGGILHESDGRTFLGGDVVSMSVHEPIVIEDTDEPYPTQYYDTPARYFALLERYTRLSFDKTVVEQPRGLDALLATADARHASVVAVRIATEPEHDALKAWLDRDRTRRALLFHSAPYAPGRRLLEEYVGRVSVPDPDPSLTNAE